MGRVTGVILWTALLDIYVRERARNVFAITFDILKLYVDVVIVEEQGDAEE